MYMHMYGYMFLSIKISEQTGVGTSIFAVRNVATAEQCRFMSGAGGFRNAQGINIRFAVKSSSSRDHDCKRGLAIYPSHP